jgi:invasion protein IalB
MLLSMRRMPRVSKMIAGASVMLGCSIFPAFAQQTPAAADVPAPEWIKVCGKDEKNNAEVCTMNSYALAEAGNVVADVRVVEIRKGKEPVRRVFEAIVPVGFLIQPGVNLVVDKNKPLPGRYKLCYPNGCLVEAQITDELLANVKKGTDLVLFAANPNGQWVGAKISLSGFSKVLDGAPTDAKVYEERRKKFEENQSKLQSELLKRAEEQRRKLQDSATPAAQGAATPAAPAKPQ